MRFFVRLAGLLAGALALAGCDDMRSASLGMVVLHDISGTYFAELDRNIATNKQVLPQLKARDAMTVAQIVDCSFSNRAVIARADVPDRPSERNTAILGIATALDRFRAGAKSSAYTDIRGALMQAASDLRGRSASQRMIVVFSDLVEDPAPTCRRDPRAPIDLAGISVVAVNVSKLEADNRNPQGWFDRIEAWRSYVEGNGGRFTLVNDPKQLTEIVAKRG